MIGRGTLRERVAAWREEGTDRDTILDELALLVE